MSTLFKKIFSAFSIGALLLVSGLGCKQTSTGPAPVALEYWTVVDDVDALNTVLKDYTVLRPYLKINVRQLRSDEFYTRLLEALAEDKGPDIVSIRSRAIGAYQSKLAAMPPQYMDTTVETIKGTLKNSIVITAQAQRTLTVPDLDREFIQTVKRDVVKDGSIYGLPLNMENMALYYNRDLLDKAGIAEPPKTWDEFQMDVKKLTKIDKQNNKIRQAGAALGTGNNIPGNDDLLYLLFSQSSVPFVDLSGRAVFNSTAKNTNDDAQTAAMKVVGFYSDFASPSRDTYTWNETMENALDSFVNGTTAFFFGYSYHYALVQQRSPQLNFGAVPMLQLNPEAPVNAANYYVNSVLNKSKHPDEAWGVIMYLTHSDATKKYLDASRRLTARLTYIDAQRDKAELAPFIAQVLVSRNWYTGKNYEAAQKAVADMYHEWLTLPPDPNRIGEWKQDALNRAVEKINQTL